MALPSALIPTIHSVPYMDVVSVLNDAGTKLTLFCVNRAQTEEIRATVRLSGFTPSSARGQQLTDPDLYAVNDDAQPDAIVLAAANVDARAGEFRHTFSHRSVSVSELNR